MLRRQQIVLSTTQPLNYSHPRPRPDASVRQIVKLVVVLVRPDNPAAILLPPTIWLTVAPWSASTTDDDGAAAEGGCEVCDVDGRP
jgi:hypothetical protein